MGLFGQSEIGGIFMKKYVYLGSLFFLITTFCLEAVSLRLENETIYPLVAKIYAAEGSLIGEEVVNPREIVQWSDAKERNRFPPQGPSTPLVPMKVHWFCSNGDAYCISDSEASGARVRTSACAGNKFCKEEKKGSK